MESPEALFGLKNNAEDKNVMDEMSREHEMDITPDGKSYGNVHDPEASPVPLHTLISSTEISIPYDSTGKTSKSGGSFLDDLSVAVPVVFKDADHQSPRIDAPSDARLQPKVLHVHGIGHLNSNEILQYFGPFKPASLEWVNSSSCNVIFWSRMAAHEALVSLGELEDENDASASPWYKGKPATKAGIVCEISFRVATALDLSPEKIPRALSFSSTPITEPNAGLSFQNRKPIVSYDDLYVGETEPQERSKPQSKRSRKARRLRRAKGSASSITDLRELLDQQSPAQKSTKGVGFDLRQLIRSRSESQLDLDRRDNNYHHPGKRLRGKGPKMYDPRKWN